MVEVKYLSMFFNKYKFTPKTKLSNFTKKSRKKIKISKNPKCAKKLEQISKKKSNAKNTTKNVSKIKLKLNKFSIESESIILDRVQLICTTYC